MAASSNPTPITPDRTPSTFRQLVESIVLLALTVTLFRAFAAEGYLISTGSMAPTLLGYHRQVACPRCSYQFARGASLDETAVTSELAQAVDTSDAASSWTACPNCGCRHIDCSQLPRNQGDQLLVHKNAYEFRDPRRWEVVVFRNYSDSSQAYVKRVVGLPRETIEVVDGNIYADGVLQRKPLPVQLAVRVPVSSLDYQPTTKDAWTSRWIPEVDGNTWKPADNALVFEGSLEPGSPTEWIRFRHLVEAGGLHVSSLTLASLPAGVELPRPGLGVLTYDPVQRLLQCRGVLSAVDLNRQLAECTDADYGAALLSLEELSHEAPVSDTYGYNAAGVLEENSVRELMVEMVLDCWQGEGVFHVELTDGVHRFDCSLNFADGSVHLVQDHDPVPVASGTLPAEAWEKPVKLVVSLFDEQVLFALNDKLLLPAWTYNRSELVSAGQASIRLGASALACEVSHVSVYRDIYYTSKAPHGQQPVNLAADELFVLGDNSPVSMDSRVWDNPAVPTSSLIGKPLLVHLPSQQKEVKWGGRSRFIRIPDFSRVRYIR